VLLWNLLKGIWLNQGIYDGGWYSLEGIIPEFRGNHVNNILSTTGVGVKGRSVIMQNNMNNYKKRLIVI
jgi:hypothetical protein